MVSGVLWKDLVKASLKKKKIFFLSMDKTAHQWGRGGWGGLGEIQEDSVLRTSQVSRESWVLHYGVIDVRKTARHSHARSVHAFKLNQNSKTLYYLFPNWPTLSSNCSP